MAKTYISNNSIKPLKTYQDLMDTTDVDSSLYDYQKQMIQRMIDIKTNYDIKIPSTYGKTTNVWSSGWGSWRLDDSPLLKKSDNCLNVSMDDGTTETITREDLIKYIGERRLVQENEVVRKVYERYQVALKLVRSDDDGDTGVRGPH